MVQAQVARLAGMAETATGAGRFAASLAGRLITVSQKILTDRSAIYGRAAELVKGSLGAASARRRRGMENRSQ